jgi:hypothetical protein
MRGFSQIMFDVVIIQIAREDARRALAIGPGDLSLVLLGRSRSADAVHRGRRPVGAVDARVTEVTERGADIVVCAYTGFQTGFQPDHRSVFVGTGQRQIGRQMPAHRTKCGFHELTRERSLVQ